MGGVTDWHWESEGHSDCPELVLKKLVKEDVFVYREPDDSRSEAKRVPLTGQEALPQGPMLKGSESH